MKHTYTVTGMTCSSCEAKVKSALLMVENVTDVEVDKNANSATITMTKHVALSDFKTVLHDRDPKYNIEAQHENEVIMQTQSWFATYKPILLLFFYITLVNLIIQVVQERFSIMQFMQYFMAGFFLAFSFFKLLNLKGFAESYAMYDVVAKRFFFWGYLYAFIEFSLGLAYLTGRGLVVTNIITLVVMSISIIGVLQSVLNKRKIKCACLGDVFNLPMTTVTIIEDALMILMSIAMIIHLN